MQSLWEAHAIIYCSSGVVMFKIPSSFKLFGQTIKITRNAKDFIESDSRVAFASYRLNEIQLNPMTFYKTKEQEEQAFFHELIHFIVYYAQDAYHHKDGEPMHRNEGFIDYFANLLHQAITTMEYDSD